VDTLVSVRPGLAEHRLALALAAVLLLALLALRRSQLGGALFVVGTYSFLGVVLLLGVVGAVRIIGGQELRAVSAQWELTAGAGSGAALSGVALVLVVTRAFASGSLAVTGVESIGTSVPAFRPPRGENAAGALLILAGVSMLLFGTITWLAAATGVRYAEDPQRLIGLPPGAPQPALMVQIGDAVLGRGFGGALVGAVTVLILLAAGASAFRAFSVLSSVLAADGLLPHQLASRGDRLVYSNGILVMAALAALLMWVFGADLSALIGLYVIGVFLALTLGQAGMVRHWRRAAASAGPSAAPGRQRSARRWAALARLATVVAGLALAAGLVSKFGRGAWLVLAIIVLLSMAMAAVRRHYDEVALELSAGDVPMSSRSRTPVTALILVSRIHKPTLRALSYARATRPTRLEALTVAVDAREAETVQREWDERGIPVPLRVLESPFREISRPVIAHVASLRKADPEGLVVIYVPEYVLGRWWHRLLHNQSAARLKFRLRSLPNVVVVSVPWQLSAALEEGAPAAGITGLTGTVPRIQDGLP
jgi:amino acid transporter